MLFAVWSVYGEELRSNDYTAVLGCILCEPRRQQGGETLTMHVKQLR